MTDIEKLGLSLLAIAVKALGGADKVKAILDAEYAATDAAIDKLEADKLAGA